MCEAPDIRKILFVVLSAAHSAMFIPGTWLPGKADDIMKKNQTCSYLVKGSLVPIPAFICFPIIYQRSLIAIPLFVHPYISLPYLYTIHPAMFVSCITMFCVT